MKSRLSLSQTHPKIASQWHPTKNGTLSPEKVTAGSNKRVYWQCSKYSDHVWEVKISSRTAFNSGCRWCANQLVDHRNSLAALFPDIAAEFHPLKNGTLTADQIVAGSGKKVWWLCKSKNPEHVWDTSVQKRTKDGRNCPYCAGKKVDSKTCLAFTHPGLCKEWDYERNTNITPKQVSAGSDKKVYWKCLTCLGSWKAPISSRSYRIRGCYHCKKYPGWNIGKLRKWLIDNIQKEQDMELLFLQEKLVKSKVLLSSGPARSVAEKLLKQEISYTEIQRFISNKHSEIDKIINCHNARDYTNSNQFSKSFRAKIYERDNHKCQNPYCRTDQNDKNKSQLTLDHKIPYSEGGGDNEDNIHTLCRSCNSSKKKKPWDEFLFFESKIKN